MGEYNKLLQEIDDLKLTLKIRDKQIESLRRFMDDIDQLCHISHHEHFALDDALAELRDG